MGGGEPGIARQRSARDYQVALPLRSTPEEGWSVMLGSGAYSKVFLCADSHGTELAVKVMSRVASFNEWQDEVHFLSRLKHPNIVRLYRSLEHPTKPEVWLLLEYCSLGAVDTLIKSQIGPFTEMQAGAVLYEVGCGLRYLHEHHLIIHRDVKAGNVFLTHEGREVFARVADFGVSKDARHESLATTVIGTPLNMAPEVIDGEPYDFKADVWSLGICGVELVRGHAPHHLARSQAELYDIVRKVAAPQVDGCALLNDVLRRCCAKDPNERPSCARLLAEAPLMSGLGGTAAADEQRKLQLGQIAHRVAQYRAAHPPPPPNALRMPREPTLPVAPSVDPLAATTDPVPP